MTYMHALYRWFVVKPGMMEVEPEMETEMEMEMEMEMQAHSQCCSCLQYWLPSKLQSP